jgi:transketolase
VSLGKATVVLTGENFWIITTWSLLELGYEVCLMLKQNGISVGLASMHTVKPLDYDFFLNKKNTVKSIFTIEEHNIIGGLGKAVSRMLCEEFDCKIKLKTFGIKDCYFHKVGSREYLLNSAGLNAKSISDKILDVISQQNFTKN